MAAPCRAWRGLDWRFGTNQLCSSSCHMLPRRKWYEVVVQEHASLVNGIKAMVCSVLPRRIR